MTAAPADIYVPASTSTSEIQAIIDTAPTGAKIHLEEGDFVVTETIVINRSDIEIIGAGEDDTRLIQSAQMQGEPVIKVGPQWVAGTVEDLPQLEHAAQQGGRMIRFEDGHDLKPGDVIYITQENSPELFAQIGDEAWQQDAPLRTFMVTVERVGGNSVALSERLPFDFDPAATTVQKMDPLENVHLEGFEVTTTYGASDPGDFSNTIGAEHRGNLIDISNTVGLSVSDITLTEPGSNGFNIAASLYANFDDITVHGAHNKGSGGNGYGIQIRDVYHSDFTGIEVTDTRHGVIFGSYSSAAGNFIEVTFTNRDINFHGGMDRFNDVIVHSSLRTTEEQAFMAPSVYVNDGASWGAPTDGTLNSVVFHHVNGTIRADEIVGHDDGAWISGYQGADTLTGGSGDDFIFGESGTDVIHISHGHDTVDGGSGGDRFVLSGGLDDYDITAIEDGFVFSGMGSVSRVTDVETFQFADSTWSQGALDGML